jgi:hypothetical protein
MYDINKLMKENNANDLLNKLSKEDSDKIKSLLKDEEKLKSLLNSEKAKKIMEMLNKGGTKNG